MVLAATHLLAFATGYAARAALSWRRRRALREP
jgi:hypothetical protein